jgi:dTDP-4-amino-4,6-dideoxygalactose transaminase
VIPHSRPRFGPAFEAALLEVLHAGQVVMGERAGRLELEVASHLAQPQAVATDSGSSALMLVLRAMQMHGALRRVGIPAYVCSSVPYAVRAAGAEPVAMDCGEDLRLLPGEAQRQAAELDAVVLVHPFGMVEPLAAETWPCPVIEDVAQAAGAELNGRPVGSFGTFAIGSFHATKPWGGAYGGFVAGDEAATLTAIRTMSDPDRSDRWPGYAGHHQLSDVHAAMALVRIDWAADESTQRQRLALRLDEWFAGLAVEPLAGRHDGNHFRYIARTSGGAEQAIGMLQAHGVGAMRPVPALWMPEAEAPAGALAAFQDCVSVPLLADMTELELRIMKEALGHAFAH